LDVLGCSYTGACNYSGENRTLSVTDTPSIDSYSPANNSGVILPITLSTTITTASLQNTTIWVWNATTAWSIINTTATSGQTQYYNPGTFPNGIFNWNITAYDTNGKNVTSGRLNFTLQNVPIVSTDTSGNCLTYQGLSYLVTAGTSETGILLDFTALGATVNTSLTNIVISGGQTAYKYANWKLLVDTANTKTFLVYVGGYDGNQTYSAATPTVSRTITFAGTSDFTTVNPFYVIAIANESNRGVWNTATSIVAHNITAFCPNYAPNTVDVKAMGKNTVVLATREIPAIVGILSANSSQYQKRVIQPMISNDNITLYYMANGTKFDTVNFILQDYSGDFQNAYLLIYKNIGANLTKIYQQKFYNLQVMGVTLEDNVWYEYVVMTSTSQRTMPWDLVSGNDNKTIVINELSQSNTKLFDPTLTVGLSSSYLLGRHGTVPQPSPLWRSQYTPRTRPPTHTTRSTRPRRTTPRRREA
jgi:hypothetical protein